MKDFQNFRATMSEEKIVEIVNHRIKAIDETLEKTDFKTPMEKFFTIEKNQTVGLIFDFLEEYHKWLNS